MTEPVVVYTGRELTVDDVVQYTDGRLEDSDETERMLNAAVAAARKYCGWHVSPVRVDDEVVVDGPGGFVLALPTMRLLELSEVVEDDTALDLATLTASASGLVRKRSGSCWTDDYSGVEVTMTHGFDGAPDWEGAVLAAIDRVTYGDARLSAGPFSYSPAGPAGGSFFTLAEKAVLDMYRLEPLA